MPVSVTLPLYPLPPTIISTPIKQTSEQTFFLFLPLAFFSYYLFIYFFLFSFFFIFCLLFQLLLSSCYYLSYKLCSYSSRASSFLTLWRLYLGPYIILQHGDVIWLWLRSHLGLWQILPSLVLTRSVEDPNFGTVDSQVFRTTDGGSLWIEESDPIFSANEDSRGAAFTCGEASNDKTFIVVSGRKAMKSTGPLEPWDLHNP